MKVQAAYSIIIWIEKHIKFTQRLVRYTRESQIHLCKND